MKIASRKRPPKRENIVTVSMAVRRYPWIVEHMVGTVPPLTIKDIIINVPYREGGDPKHCCDIYCPPSATRRASSSSSTTHSADAQLRPVVIHFHGGGWVAGDRAYDIFGSPSMCNAYASAGLVAIAPSYRLRGLTWHGNPHAHIEDAVCVVQWVTSHIQQFGGDPGRIYISGHSAGANIAALLGVSGAPRIRERIPDGTIKGVVAISGLYTLRGIFRGLRSVQEWPVQSRFVSNTFGQDDPVLLHENSPCSILGASVLSLAAAAAPGTSSVPGGSDGERTSDGMTDTITNSITEIASTITGSATGTTANPELQYYSSAEQARLSDPTVAPTLVRARSQLPPFVLINAYSDMGLETNAARFQSLLRSHGVQAQHQSVMASGTNHATISWTTEAHQYAVDFIRRCDGSPPINHQPATNTTATTASASAPSSSSSPSSSRSVSSSWWRSSSG